MSSPNQMNNSRGGVNSPGPFYGSSPQITSLDGFIPLNFSSPVHGSHNMSHQPRSNYSPRGGNWNSNFRGGRAGRGASQLNRSFPGHHGQTHYQNMHGAQQMGGHSQFTPRKQQGQKWNQQADCTRGGNVTQNIEDYVHPSMWEDPWKGLLGPKTNNDSLSFEGSEFGDDSSIANSTQEEDTSGFEDGLMKR